MDPIVTLARHTIEQGSKSFASAARLLPSGIREDAYLLYAWCRHCDDVIDDQELGFASGVGHRGTSEERLTLLTEKTRAALRGEAEEPVFQALSRVVSRHAIPERHPLELVRGFEMDVAGRTYRTTADTLDYCYHVAGVVGVMMAMVMGVRDRDTLNRASDLGLAFQLTNIARDVVPDAIAGRVYLPEDLLLRVGLRPEPGAIANPANRAAVFAVTNELLALADAYYRSALYGMGRLPLGAAVGIGAARHIYRDIGRIVRKRGCKAWDGRAASGRFGKAVGAMAGAVTALHAHALVRLKEPPARNGLWTMSGLGEG